MKRALIPITALAIIAAIGIAAGSNAADPPTGLHLVGKQITEAGPNGRPHPGNMIVFSGKETGDDSGRSYVHCVLIDAKHGLCTGEFVLARGRIALQTAIPLEDSPKTITLAITGGTGAYDGARGTATFTDIGKDKTDEVFAFGP